MTSWQCRDGREGASKKVLSVLDAIQSYLNGQNESPANVLSICIDEEEYSCEVEIELIPCVVLLVIYGPDRDDEYDNWNYDVDALDVVDIASIVSFWTHYYEGIELQDLADSIVTTRRRLDIMSQSLTAKGIPMELQDLRIVHTSTWRSDENIPVIARYRSLNYHLEMEAFEIKADSPNEILDSYSSASDLFKRRASLRDHFARFGAHGSIDSIAVNTIGLNHNVSNFLRSNGLKKTSAPGLFVLDNNEGHVSCFGSDATKKKFLWYDNSVTIMNFSLPETILSLLPGRPITEAIDHPVLTSDLIITRAWVEYEASLPKLKIEFDQPRFLFCRDTGRVWIEGS